MSLLRGRIMFQRTISILIFSILLLGGCSSHVNKKSVHLPLNKKYAIASFWNYTETPMAGLRSATIVESVLAQKNLAVASLIGGSEELVSSKSKQAFLKTKIAEAKALGVDYLIFGNVQEWRYKTGIDGEPVVSYSMKVVNLKSGAILFNGVGAKSGWGHKSIGVVAQEIAEELIPQFIN